VSHPTASACYCRLRFIDADGAPLEDPPCDPRWGWSRFGRRPISDDSPATPLEAIWTRHWAIPSCFLIRRSAFAATAGWDRAMCPPDAIFGAEDKDMAIQLALQGELHRLPQRLVDYRVMPSTYKDALYEGFKTLNVKWWSAPLGDEARARVRRAIRFEYRVAALDAVGALGRAGRHPGTGELGTASSSLVRATLRWALASARMEHWSRAQHRVANVGPRDDPAPSYAHPA
jgi:hypothetical protein